MEVPADPWSCGEIGSSVNTNYCQLYLHLSIVTVKPDRLLALLPTTGGKDQVPSITTTPIYLETFRETTTLFCKIIAPPAVQPVDKRWPDVEVTIEVRPKK